ncbi:ARL14 effector protein [Aphidius gifuensis]|uniref:ARL14 effector protein n=1 Tax=Aphidius gifuensis TaxID=684658 RepID=UPI001CDCD449|nr:ARL14 effector protein [Aphidius gifuensis]
MADDDDTHNNKRSGRGYRNKQRQTDNVAKKFLRDFDPQSSEREKRKLHRRLYPGSRKHILFDESGVFIKSGTNLCDCLKVDCPGCHFPCSKCGSRKCAHECRQLRRWAYESVENEGSDVIQKNNSL